MILQELSLRPLIQSHPAKLTDKQFIPCSCHSPTKNTFVVYGNQFIVQAWPFRVQGQQATVSSNIPHVLCWFEETRLPLFSLHFCQANEKPCFVSAESITKNLMMGQNSWLVDTAIICQIWGLSICIFFFFFWQKIKKLVNVHIHKPVIRSPVNKLQVSLSISNSLNGQ